MDAFLTATARSRGMTLVTRNTRDFRGLGVEVFDPWE
jgi:predicted nucleic acid-binding protein